SADANKTRDGVTDWGQWPIQAGAVNPPYNYGPASGRPTLREGDKGSAVHILQVMLDQAGATLAHDSAFGPATKQAVLSFQQKHGLAADGVVGAKTWAALDKAVAQAQKKPQSPPVAPKPAPQPKENKKVLYLLKGDKDGTWWLTDWITKRRV